MRLYICNAMKTSISATPLLDGMYVKEWDYRSHQHHLHINRASQPHHHAHLILKKVSQHQHHSHTIDTSSWTLQHNFPAASLHQNLHYFHSILTMAVGLSCHARVLLLFAVRISPFVSLRLCCSIMNLILFLFLFFKFGVNDLHLIYYWYVGYGNEQPLWWKQ